MEDKKDNSSVITKINNNIYFYYKVLDDFNKSPNLVLPIISLQYCNVMINIIKKN